MPQPNRPMVWMMALLAGALPLVSSGPAPAGEAPTDPASPKGYVGQDWPQWRGPTRDGIAPAGPKLLDRWPKEGPPLLWKSEPIPGSSDGGSGSLVVAGGKVFVYANWHSPVKIMTEKLKAHGWEEGVPADLARKVEAARGSKDRTKLKTDA